MRGLLAIVLLASACKFHAGTPGDAMDAAIDTLGDDVIDASNRPRWGPPVEVVTAVGDDDPTLTTDMRMLYFNRAGDLWYTTRASTSAAWNTPQEDTDLSTVQNEGSPELSGDGLTIFFSSTRMPSSGMVDIWMATRTSRTSSWNTITNVGALNSANNETGAAPSEDLRTIVMDSDRFDGGAYDLYISTRSSPTGTWNTPTPLAEPNIPRGNRTPHLASDGLSVYFNSSANPTDDLYVARRSAIGDLFSNPEPITELNTSMYDENDAWLSQDGTILYFTSNASGTNTIMMSTLEP